ncbi:2-C-methyl-D-erythritol 2,4-cyclodiphosphate synthase [Bacteroidota bacterium]
MNSDFRIGFGVDVHQFAYNRKLILGGVEIPYEKGLQGHSDADVLLHSIADALLGSLSMGDIGKHFPDNDPQFKNADSKYLLKQVYEMVLNKGYEIGNIDATLMIENPKIANFIDPIRESIADVLSCSTNQISVKATTSEELGFVGREEGVKAFAVVIIMKAKE